MTAAAVPQRPRLRAGPIIAALVLTVLLLWLLGAVAQILILLFLSILISLYLGAVTDFLVARLRVPRRAAFVLALLATLGAIVGFFFLLVPPVVAQTQQLVTVLPEYVVTWESAIERFLRRFPDSGPTGDPATTSCCRWPTSRWAATSRTWCPSCSRSWRPRSACSP